MKKESDKIHGLWFSEPSRQKLLFQCNENTLKWATSAVADPLNNQPTNNAVEQKEEYGIYLFHLGICRNDYYCLNLNASMPFQSKSERK